MDREVLKKFLAGLCVASLLSGASLGLVGCHKDGKMDSTGKTGTQGTQETGKSG